MKIELRRYLKLKAGQQVAFVTPGIKGGVTLSVVPV
jgi:hypothetical protein